jgi:hypothetical protein
VHLWDIETEKHLRSWQFAPMEGGHVVGGERNTAQTVYVFDAFSSVGTLTNMLIL